jgi:large subunit ribosomal protein L18
MAKKTKKVRMTSRQRSKFRIRKKISGTDERPRISVSRSDKHIYAQVISDTSGKTLAAASTLDKEVIDAIAGVSDECAPNDAKSTKSVRAAYALGSILGQRCKAKNIESAVFDRNGLLYHGRVKALADGAREAGLKF